MAGRWLVPRKFHDYFVLFLTVCTLGLLIYMLIFDGDTSNDKWFYTWLGGQVVVGLIGYWFMRTDYRTEMFVSKEDKEKEFLLNNTMHKD